MEQEFRTYLTTLFKVPVVDRSKSLTGYGMDSFMSIEISEWCQTRLKVPVTQLDLLLGITIDEILTNCNNPNFRYKVRAVKGVEGVKPVETGSTPPPPPADSGLIRYATVAVGAWLVYYLFN